MPSDFKKLMTARFFFTFAVQMQVIVLGWRMYELTKDALYLGLIGLVEAIPAIGLALFAGYIVDRSRPLIVYRCVVGISTASACLMLLGQLPSFGVTPEHQVYFLFISSFLTGCARAFSQPAMFSLVSKLITRSQYAKASAWMSSVMSTARISGPAVGGLLYGFMHVSGSATVVLCSLLVTATTLFLIENKYPKNSPQKGSSVKEDLLSGAMFVLRHPVLFPALSLDMFCVLFGGVTALLPVFAAEVLFVGPSGLGILRAAPAIGAMVMSYVLISREIKANAGTKLFASVFGFGICILVFSLSRSFTLSLIALFLSGVFDSVSMVIRSAAVQLVSPDHMRGRISAVNSIFIGSSNELGEFESGVAAKFMGAVPAGVFGGCMCLLIAMTVSGFSRTLRRLDLGELEKA